MTFKYCKANYLFFPTYVELDDNKQLEYWLDRKSDLDFGNYAPKGGGTTHAHLRWTDEQQVLFEGVDVPNQTLKGDLTPAWIAVHWRIFLYNMAVKTDLGVDLLRLQ